jgi:hypothetical protein
MQKMQLIGLQPSGHALASTQSRRAALKAHEALIQIQAAKLGEPYYPR